MPADTVKNHPRIVNYLGVGQNTEEGIDILLEFVGGGSIAKQLKSGAFSEAKIRKIIRQLLEALVFLQSRGIAHRDIKGLNILLTPEGDVKLADFGSARISSDSTLERTSSQLCNYTPYWAAPEVIKGTNSTKSDIWSLGCVMIEMATAKPPWAEKNYNNIHQLQYNIALSTEIPAIPPHLSELCIEFAKLCLTRDASKRPSAETLLNHDWITGASSAQCTQNSGNTIVSSLPAAQEIVEAYFIAERAKAKELAENKKASTLTSAAILPAPKKAAEVENKREIVKLVNDDQPDAASVQPDTASDQPGAASKEPGAAPLELDKTIRLESETSSGAKNSRQSSFSSPERTRIMSPEEFEKLGLASQPADSGS